MGGRGLLCWLVAIGASVGACDQAEAPPDRIEVASAHRSCAEDEACGVVETSCQSQGCECGVAVNEKHLLDYQKALAECRGQRELGTCDFQCETPFAKCFNGACVLTDEPQELFNRGRNLRRICERTRGQYVGCPECPPNTRCKSCLPCECPSTHRWSKKGCRAVVQTEARDIPVEVRPRELAVTGTVKTRIHNESKRTIWLKTLCGTPFFRARKKEDQWDKRYEPFVAQKCKAGAIEIDAGDNRPFVVKNLRKFREPSGQAMTPGTYRFELTYTDGSKSFRYSGTVYSGEFDVVQKISRR